MTTFAHEHWSSRFAFLMAAIGSAVGLGNIWRFPFIAGENGGAAFVIIYMMTTLGIALPILIAEILIGRMGGQSPIGSMVRLARAHKKARLWAVIGWGGTIGAFVVLSYYSVIGGWALKYTTLAVSNAFAGVDGEGSGALFADFTASPLTLFFWHTLFMGINIVIVIGGLHKGIERAVTTLMPLLFLLLLGMVVYAAQTPGFDQALGFLFKADFSKVTAMTFLTAVGQGFFSVSVALGAMMTYGAYLDQSISIPRSAFIIALADTGVALLAGLAIFPLVFTYALAPGAGPGLVFVTVPIAFGQMDNGVLVGTAFFVLLSVAAITSAISLLEPAVSWAEEKFSGGRRTATLVVGGACWLLGLASVLSFNDWSEFYPLASLGFLDGKTVFDIFDFTVTSWVQPTVGILMALFAGWALSREEVMAALGVTRAGALWFRLWLFAIRILCPLAILLVFASAVWPDFVASMVQPAG
ncbi:sodium-dependent transporter [Tepidicaulis sp.]|uniref:sodium-dependent transporter n=1 Tax=Tepidicaulis sp. TaxID=1920809 RepID=UPI003B5A0064